MQRSERIETFKVDKPQTADDTFDRLMWEIGRAYYAYVGLAERILVEEGLADQVQPGMGLVLFSLYEQDSRTIKEIAARSQLASSTLSGLLGRMEKAGLIQRTRDAGDARLVRVSLTARGRGLEPKCRAMVERISGVIREGLGRQVEIAHRMLRRLTETLRVEEERMVRCS